MRIAPLPSSSLAPPAISEAADYLHRARVQGREVERLTLRHPELNLHDAYLIQDAGIERRAQSGEKVIGLKMGLTSKAKREQMKLDSPIYGVLTEPMRVRETFPLKGSIHPKIEPEIAFVMAKELSGFISQQQALAAVSGVGAAMEILDSRFIGFKYFSLPDVVADNSSSSHFVMSDRLIPPSELSVDALATLAMDMQVNGISAQKAVASEISGNPLQSIVQLCEILQQRGRVLPAGSIVLAGAATQAVELETGMHVRLVVERLGEVSVLAA
ncbi:MAG: fumarylacetoacetate hydrolase family protein [Deltaproteobacteria bacterium]|nr:fumarylacetoacetate hydrolase family protein [Deltaproteobacteria bacterium]